MFTFTHPRSNTFHFISLHNVRHIETFSEGGSKARFAIRITYFGNEEEYVRWLTAEESEHLFNEMISVLAQKEQAVERG